MKKIQILGTGCMKCQKLSDTAEAAAQELGIAYELEKVKEIKKVKPSAFTIAEDLQGNPFLTKGQTAEIPVL